MRIGKKWIATGICVLLASILYIQCTSNSISGGETVNERIIVYLPDGKPAPNTKIRFYDYRDTSLSYKYQVVTDENGSYALPEDAALNGQYNVWEEYNDSIVGFQNSVLIKSNINFITNDTLSLSSSLNASVKLQPIHDPRTVTVHVLGTHKYANVDEYGKFTLIGMAQGQYTLLIKTTVSGYTDLYSTINISSGANITLTKPFELIYTGIPVVTGLKISYDSTNGIVTLSWDKVSYPQLQDYLVYRAFYESIQWPTDPIKQADTTVIYDTIYNKNLATGQFSWSDTNDYRLKYRVCVRNNVDQIGLPYKYTQTFTTSPNKNPPAITIRLYKNQKEVDAINNKIKVGDSILITTTYYNTKLLMNNIRIYLPGDSANIGITIKDKPIIPPAKSGVDSTWYRFKKAGSFEITSYLKDKSQFEWFKTKYVDITWPEEPIITQKFYKNNIEIIDPDSFTVLSGDSILITTKYSHPSLFMNHFNQKLVSSDTINKITLTDKNIFPSSRSGIDSTWYRFKSSGWYMIDVAINDEYQNTWYYYKNLTIGIGSGPEIKTQLFRNSILLSDSTDINSTDTILIKTTYSSDRYFMTNCKLRINNSITDKPISPAVKAGVDSSLYVFKNVGFNYLFVTMKDEFENEWKGDSIRVSVINVGKTLNSVSQNTPVVFPPLVPDGIIPAEIKISKQERKKGRKD